ncbi:eosinophil cationic protein 1-like [Mus pahari]|uniref:eosinophil cationic protein 1-like n=1 Tax=Mus pahari TaxID=10093 RepID=UPI0011150441|nr:eosinophil cationic protein 1-like [Mus pahari]
MLKTLSHHFHPHSLLYIYGAKWSSPMIPDFQDNHHSVPRELQRRLGNMGSKLLESRLCLLLMLELVLMLASCQGQTPCERFSTQYLTNRASLRCNVEMLPINTHRRTCKNKHTFLHTSLANAVDVCGNPSGLCSDMNSLNCHNSSSQVPITVCELISWERHYTQCRYRTTGSVEYYTVACNPRTPEDSPIYPVVPVHLDKTF